LIAVIDYGLGNLRSVTKALESLGASIELTNKPEIISKANGVVLPGVGAFYKGIENINKLGLADPISQYVAKGKPFLGICLGLQLLFSESEEHGIHKGLGIIKGKVKKFESSLKIPHMGWNVVQQTNRKEPLFNNIPDESYFYFVHSYFVEPVDKKDIASQTPYGQNFCSAITKKNLFGVQFHPEKSADLGIKLLENFIKICQ